MVSSFWNKLFNCSKPKKLFLSLSWHEVREEGTKGNNGNDVKAQVIRAKKRNAEIVSHKVLGNKSHYRFSSLTHVFQHFSSNDIHLSVNTTSRPHRHIPNLGRTWKAEGELRWEHGFFLFERKVNSTLYLKWSRFSSYFTLLVSEYV